MQAIYEACLARFRPILMTTLAAMLGAVPLIIAAGPGSELRRPLGITIIGGLLVSQILTLYTTPVIYLLLDRLHHRLWGRSSLRPPCARALPDRAEVLPSQLSTVLASAQANPVRIGRLTNKFP